MRDERNRQAEPARVFAEMGANLTSIPSELRLVAEAQQNRKDSEERNFMQEAARHVGRQAQENHTQSIQILSNNITDTAGYAMQMGRPLGRALDKLKRERIPLPRQTLMQAALESLRKMH